MTGPVKPIAVLALAFAVAPAGAYYHYIHYTNRSAPYAPAPEKFDLAALPDKTVTFYVSDQGPTLYLQGDGFASVLNQVSEAAKTWNAVATSDLRVAFGGLYRAGVTSTTPWGDVVFEELPPAVLGLGGPTAREEIRVGANGPFVPITRATVRISRDLTQRPGPSYGDAFFQTVLHEMGHALGLQHTLTSSAMATDVTRATSRAKPLDDDDIAGLSLLYPARGFPAGFGSLTGRVVAGLQSIHLASVVAIRQTGGAISALTAPDGTYRIDGLPPGQYLVYAHPLPPASLDGLGPANVVLPLDADKNSMPASGAFDTMFFPGTRDLASAMPLTVAAGGVVENVNFFVQPRSAPAIYGVTTWSFYDQTPVRPSFLNTNPGMGTVVAYGAGLTSGLAVAPGLTVGTLDTAEVLSPNSIRAYGNPAYLAFDLLFNSTAGTGPRHLLFGNGSDIYVLPGALQLVQKLAPSIASVTPVADATGGRTVIISGSNLAAETRYYFNGAPAVTRSFDLVSQQAVVAAPPAPAGQRAVVTALNPDGQSSTFVQSLAPASYLYPAGDPPQVLISPTAVPAGTEAMVEITGSGTHFTDGYTAAGFGNADVAVRRLFVLGPTLAIANVAAAPGAAPGVVGASVTSGLEVSTLPAALQVLPQNARAMYLSSQLVNAATGTVGVYPGAVAIVSGANLVPVAGSTPTILLRDMTALKDVPIPALAVQGGQISFQIPPNWPVGPTVLKYYNGVDMAPPVAVSIDMPALAINSLLNGAGETLDLNRTVRPGDTVTLLLSNVGDPGKDIALSRWKVDVGGVAHSPVAGSWTALPAGTYALQIVLAPALAAGQYQVTVTLDGRSSRSVPLVVKP